MTELTENERIIYDALVTAANASAPCPGNDALNELIGSGNDSEAPRLLGRLEVKGYIEREVFQRSRRVGIKATGKWTALPLNTAPHWRNRPKDVPTPAPVVVKTRRPDIAAEIFTEAARLGKPAVEYLADLVFVGWEVEKARG